MRINLIPGKGTRRFAGVLAAAGAAAFALGLIPAASASIAAPAGPAAEPAAISSTCHWLPTPAQFWVTDPVNSPVGLIGSIYGQPGTVGVAYRINGQFTHTTTMSFTVYNNLNDIPGANYVINDSQIIPDPGSVNPFVPGTLVEGKPRNYTAYLWPDSVPVPAGLKNVVLYPTKPYAPGTGPARWAVAMRQYHPQPGYTQLQGMRQTKITAISASTMAPVRCPLRAPGSFSRIQIQNLLAHEKYWGPIPLRVPEPRTGNKIYFVSAPAVLFLGLDGYPGPLPQSCLQYMVAQLPRAEISVVTMHKVPTYFNNDLVTPTTVMGNYQIRYQSFGVNYFTVNTRRYDQGWINTDDAVYTAKGQWVTVYLPGDPRLPAAEIAHVRSLARTNHFNVIQMPPPPTGPLATRLPYPSIALRQKTISPSFPYSNLNLACWSQNHSYKTWTDQSSPAFFAKYASSPKNNGPYWVGGVKLTFTQFVKKYS